MVTINLDNIEVKEGEFKTYLKEDGKYKVTVTDFQQGVSENTGTPYIKFEFKTDADEYITASFYLTEKAYWRFKKFIMALGHPGTGTIDPVSVAKMCVGKSLNIECAHRMTVDPVTGNKEVGKYLEVMDFSKC